MDSRHIYPIVASDMAYKRVDYSRAKALVLSGESYANVAQRLGLSHTALAKFAQRHGWQKDVAQVREQVSSVVEDRLAKTAQSWIRDIQDVVNPALEQLKKFDWSKTHELDAEAATRVLKSIDDLGRRSLGIQEASNAPQTLVQVVVNGGSGITVKQHPNTLDVTNPE